MIAKALPFLSLSISLFSNSSSERASSFSSSSSFFLSSFSSLFSSTLSSVGRFSSLWIIRGSTSWFVIIFSWFSFDSSSSFISSVWSLLLLVGCPEITCSSSSSAFDLHFLFLLSSLSIALIIGSRSCSKAEPFSDLSFRSFFLSPLRIFRLLF